MRLDYIAVHRPLPAQWVSGRPGLRPSRDGRLHAAECTRGVAPGGTEDRRHVAAVPESGLRAHRRLAGEGKPRGSADYTDNSRWQTGAVARPMHCCIILESQHAGAGSRRLLTGTDSACPMRRARIRDRHMGTPLARETWQGQRLRSSADRQGPDGQRRKSAAPETSPAPTCSTAPSASAFWGGATRHRTASVRERPKPPHVGMTCCPRN